MALRVFSDLNDSVTPTSCRPGRQRPQLSRRQRQRWGDAVPAVVLALLLASVLGGCCLLLGTEDRLQTPAHRTGFPLSLSVPTWVASGHLPSGSGLCPAAPQLFEV